MVQLQHTNAEKVFPVHPQIRNGHCSHSGPYGKRVSGLKTPSSRQTSNREQGENKTWKNLEKLFYLKGVNAAEASHSPISLLLREEPLNFQGL